MSGEQLGHIRSAGGHNRPSSAGSRLARGLPVALAVATVLAQIAYPLTPVGQPRDALTVVTVVLFATTSLVHAAVWRGPRFATVLFVVTAGGGLLAEAVGVATGVPFGAYRYTGTLGWQLLGVPVVIPLAWTMMAYPAQLVGRRIAGARSGASSRLSFGTVTGSRLERSRRILTGHPVRGIAAAGAALASWDLFLDPQMVDAGHWVWAGASGLELLGIPVRNFLAWLVVATLMMAVLWPLVPAAHRMPATSRAAPQAIDDRVPYALYLWTYASSVLAHAAFFGLPGSALLGGIGMGVVVLLFVRAVRR